MGQHSFYLSEDEGDLVKRLILKQGKQMGEFAGLMGMHPTILSRIIHGQLPLDLESAATMYKLLGENKVLQFLPRYATQPPPERLRAGRSSDGHRRTSRDAALYRWYVKLENIYHSLPLMAQEQMKGDLERLTNHYFSKLVERNKRREGA